MKTLRKNSIISVIATEWFDKVNGNSYFSGKILINGERVIKLPFQYGYGNQWRHEAIKQIMQDYKLPTNEATPTGRFHGDLAAKNIKITFDKFEGLKRDMI